ncbi:HSP20-like chaperone [Chaetomium tenue]|uniref:HSP20-like chaperone n=1 Tax=Chaetomium tenue TaxID=1854479 RepID=A0ACB7P9P8_9PEZI|nr:HSP20-like chaperone [Chaetomium globosum]
MMHTFPASFCAPQAAEPKFFPLFRLLSDFDNYSQEGRGASVASAPAARQQRAKQTRPQPITVHPRFDVRETEEAYELHGELPGLERENISIEFPEHQTIVISGSVERNYASDSTKDTAALEPTPSETNTETEEPRRNSHQATVEDDPEDDNTPTSSRASSPWMDVAKPVAHAAAEETTQTPAQAPKNQSKYWLRERSVGRFSRTITFPARIDEDNATAALKNGILSITVPKAKVSTPTRIQITA